MSQRNNDQSQTLFHSSVKHLCMSVYPKSLAKRKKYLQQCPAKVRIRKCLLTQTRLNEGIDCRKGKQEEARETREASLGNLCSVTVTLFSGLGDLSLPRQEIRMRGSFQGWCNELGSDPFLSMGHFDCTLAY